MGTKVHFINVVLRPGVEGYDIPRRAIMVASIEDNYAVFGPSSLAFNVSFSQLRASAQDWIDRAHESTDEKDLTKIKVDDRWIRPNTLDEVWSLMPLNKIWEFIKEFEAEMNV